MYPQLTSSNQTSAGNNPFTVITLMIFPSKIAREVRAFLSSPHPPRLDNLDKEDQRNISLETSSQVNVKVKSWWN